MRLYEIDREMEACIDWETGEIIDVERLDALQMERTAKLEGVACWIKNLEADAKALKAEEDALYKRRIAAQRKVEDLKAWLAEALQGQALTTPKAAVSFRKSERLKVNDEEGLISWAMYSDAEEFLNYRVPTLNSAAIKQALKEGRDIPFVEIEKRQNIQIS